MREDVSERAQLPAQFTQCGSGDLLFLGTPLRLRAGRETDPPVPGDAFEAPARLCKLTQCVALLKLHALGPVAQLRDRSLQLRRVVHGVRIWRLLCFQRAETPRTVLKDVAQFIQLLL